VSGSGIIWAICKSASRSRQITMPSPHHSVFYILDALPANQAKASKHWRPFGYHDMYVCIFAFITCTVLRTESELPWQCPYITLWLQYWWWCFWPSGEFCTLFAVHQETENGKRWKPIVRKMQILWQTCTCLSCCKITCRMSYLTSCIWFAWKHRNSVSGFSLRFVVYVVVHYVPNYANSMSVLLCMNCIIFTISPKIGRIGES